ncbi:response regulator [Diplocloster hominis]|uniref:response regulator n=1 Tax=Diplocloster hominis TaxID=3079010 RepID=UPI0031BAE5E2
MNVMIVDDEVLMRTTLKYMLNEEIPAFTGERKFVLCAEASNGKEALDKLPTVRPDILLTDMKMPEMDGLLLCEQANRLMPQVPFIALSNYDDYEYVRGALKGGAVDYLLKHALTPQGLLAALEKAAAGLMDRPAHSRLTDNNLAALRQDFLIHLLTGFYSDPAEIRAHFLVLALPLEPIRMLPLLMCIDDYQARDLANNNLITFSIVNIVTEILTDQKNGAMCHISNEKYAMVLSFGYTRSESAIHDTIQNTIGRITFCMKKFLNLSVSFSLGTLSIQPADLPASYRQAEENLCQKFYCEPGSIFTRGNGTSASSDFDFLSISRENALKEAVLQRDSHKAHQLLDEIFSDIRRQKPPLPVTQMAFTDLLGLLNQICKKQAINFKDIYDDDTLSGQYLYDFPSLSTVQEWIASLFDRLIDRLQKREVPELSVYMRQALNYIHEHFAEPLSQSGAASQIHISSVYLSKLFRQELNVSFPDYLMQVRLNHAARLLRSEHLPIREVAAKSGFNDYIYFLKCFKKKMGCTPTEYLKRL